MLDAAASALGAFLDPTLLGMLTIGVVAGLVMGIIPGLGGTGAVAVLLPFAFVLEPQQALAMIIGAVAVVHTSDVISAVLLGVPGSASATVILMDGHEMAKRGQAARALSVSFLSSMAGGILGAIGLTLSIPVARPLVLAFGSPELFMLTVLGISLTALLSRGHMLKGLLAGALGVLLGQVGVAPAAADYRFTFGTLFLNEGLDLVATALGIFGLAEIAHLVAKRGAVSDVAGLGGGWRTGLGDVLRHWSHVLRGAVVGIWAGVLPGVGATAGTWMAYGQARASAKRKEKRRFGRGDPRGIIGPESANNSVEAGDLIPTLLFGIPGGAPAALLLGALLLYGIEPGPRLVTENLDLVYTIVWSFALASVLGAAMCFVLSRPLARLSTVHFPVLGAGLVVLMFVSAYQEPQQFGVLQVMLLLGVVGWLMKATGVPRAPFLIGFVLAIPMERYYFLTDRLYTTSEWLLRPGVLVMGLVLVAPLVLAARHRWSGRRATGEPAEVREPVAVSPGAGPDGASRGAAADVARTGVGTADGAEGTAGGPDDPVHDEDADDDEGTDVGALEGTWMPAVLAASFALVFAGALVASADFSPRAALVPRIVGVVGLVLALCVAAREVRARRGAVGGGAAGDGATGDTAGDRETGDQTRRAHVRDTGVAFGWMVLFLVLVYLGGIVLASALFVPLFLLRVAGMRASRVAVYTTVLLAALLALHAYGDIALPVGLFTPEVFR